MNKMKYLLCIIIILSVGCNRDDNSGMSSLNNNEPVDYNLWKIEDGKFYIDGKWKFLKIAKPLRNFADKAQVDQLISNLDLLKSKNYSSIEINCYWHHFDTNGDGIPDKSLEPLNKLVNAIYEKGMYPCLSVETYSVGGGQIPDGFWDIYPKAYAIDEKGKRISDTEYGFGTDVISIFHSGYRETAHTFIKSIAKAVDTKKILYFETTVEPQYMGTINLGYSESARSEYSNWRIQNKITDSESEMPESFPISQNFIENKTWNKFRAQFLAKWVNGDAAAYREVAGQNSYVAVDFLDAEESTTRSRNGDPVEFLSHLTAPNIIQVNWHWYFPSNEPNQKAYDRVWGVMRDKERDWAVSEHMTFNGTDFNRYTDEELKKILLNTLKQGTRFGWEFVSVGNGGSFSLYGEEWKPKRVMKMVDENWDYWLNEIKRIENE
jgi:hypothetical protein